MDDLHFSAHCIHHFVFVDTLQILEISTKLHAGMCARELIHTLRAITSRNCEMDIRPL